MFEKEAIRHAFEYTTGVECLIKPVEDFTYEELDDEQQEKAYDFQKGAEFGYNKAKEEMQEQGLALQSDMDKTIEQNLQLKKELNKANEWHYVKNGDLPKETNKFYVYSKEWGVEIRKFFADVGYFECRKDIIISWKEIVPPDLSSSELLNK